MTEPNGPASVREHYEVLLGEHYDWMVGRFDVVAREQSELLAGLLGRSGHEGRGALDLGCGTGVHTLALGALGYGEVTCVDVSPTMLARLQENTRGHVVVDAVQADLDQGLPAAVRTASFDAAVCMGDSLTHLTDLDAVGRLLGDLLIALVPGGRLVLSFRDLTEPPRGTGRFIPVRSDADTIMTCFLEDASDHVQVHDLIHTRTAEGWAQRISSYRKLKLAPGVVARLMTSAGFEATQCIPGPRGVWVLVGQRPAAE